MPFCPHCGLEYGQPANFCNRCGRALPVAAARESPVTAAMPLELPYYLSLNRIIFMTALTFGFYLFYWFYLTWQQYRDYTGREAYPIWHALTLLVPIYSLFRTHAHASAYRDLMRDAGIPGSIKAWLAVVLALIPKILSLGALIASFRPEALTQDSAADIALIDAGTTVLVIALLIHLQSNINWYWYNRTNGRVSSARIRVGEVVFAILGILTWAGTLANIFSESW